MSSYVHFYIRDTEVSNKYIYLTSWSRCNAVYEIFYNIMGNNIKRHGEDDYVALPLTKSNIRDLIDAAKTKRDNYQKMIEDNRALKADILIANNSLEEKMEQLDSLKETDLEIQEEINGLITASNFFWLLDDFLEVGNDNARICAGIEGDNPNILMES